eukprot:1179232-Prorocentrum_minimum.AAC.3
MTDQSDAVSAGILSRRTNRTCAMYVLAVPLHASVGKLECMGVDGDDTKGIGIVVMLLVVKHKNNNAP